jgi:uncharacterized protein YbjT (DUF2867 family)
MRVFITGASGFVGSALVPELLGAGHRVVGLARSDGSAAALRAAGAEVHRGSLEDLESLRAGAAGGDAVVHLAFDGTSGFAEAARIDAKAVETIGAVLAWASQWRRSPLPMLPRTSASWERSSRATHRPLAPSRASCWGGNRRSQD